MIRINLFPVRQARLREKGKQQLAIGVGVVSVILATVVVYHGYQTAENARIQAKNAKLTAEIDKLKKEVGDYEVVKQQRADFLRQKEIFQKLIASRAGPVYLMRELSDILSKGKGPSFDKTEYEDTLRHDPNAGFNPNWDSRRLWVLSFVERNKNVTVKGQAKSSDDVAEFGKRLKISPFFQDVYWEQTTPQFDAKRNINYVNFDLKCRVTY